MLNPVKSHEYRPKHRKPVNVANVVLFGLLGAYVTFVVIFAPRMIRTFETILDKLL